MMKNNETHKLMELININQLDENTQDYFCKKFDLDPNVLNLIIIARDDEQKDHVLIFKDCNLTEGGESNTTERVRLIDRAHIFNHINEVTNSSEIGTDSVNQYDPNTNRKITKSPIQNMIDQWIEGLQSS